MKRLNENISRIKTLMGVYESEEVDSMNDRKGEDDQEPIQKQCPDGMDEDYITEKSVSKQHPTHTATTTADDTL
jgi:hypothetical protein